MCAQTRRADPVTAVEPLPHVVFRTGADRSSPVVTGLWDSRYEAGWGNATPGSCDAMNARRTRSTSTYTVRSWISGKWEARWFKFIVDPIREGAENLYQTQISKSDSNPTCHVCSADRLSVRDRVRRPRRATDAWRRLLRAYRGIAGSDSLSTKRLIVSQVELWLP